MMKKNTKTKYWLKTAAGWLRIKKDNVIHFCKFAQKLEIQILLFL